MTHRAPSSYVRAGSRIRERRADLLLVGLPAVLMLWLSWRRRWISDDGLIFTRVVRQVLAGHGPVFNVGDRAESATSVLWTYLVAFLTWITRADPARVAVFTGLVLTAAGLAFGIAGSRRLWGRVHGAVVLPAGVAVVLGLPPFWNFATSGLDTSLAFCWIGSLWWLLVRARQSSGSLRERGAWATAVVAGLGPLIRPELAIAAIGMGAALVLSLRPLARREVLQMLGLWLVVPLLYEIFRATYFGILVPLPAISKAATSSDWHRGFSYLVDFLAPYRLFVPALLIGALLALFVRPRASYRRPSVDSLLVGAPVLSGLVMTLYVVRVGGDFMHARLLLAPLLLIVLPFLVVPVRGLGVLALVGLIAWAFWCGISPRPDLPTTDRPVGPHGVVDERAFWVKQTGDPHPTSAAPFVRATQLPQALQQAREQAAATGQGVLILVGPGASPTYQFFPLRRGLRWRVVVFGTNLGRGGAATRLSEAVFDPEGLAYPLAAHSQLVKRGRPGHEKTLPLAYLVADLVDPAAAVPGVSAADVQQARNELGCPVARQLRASTRDPVSLGRLWTNLVNSFGMTGAEVPIRVSAGAGC